jgi:hypothetical protein
MLYGIHDTAWMRAAFNSKGQTSRAASCTALTGSRALRAADLRKQGSICCGSKDKRVLGISLTAYFNS